MIFRHRKVRNTIFLLKTLKTEKNSLYDGVALGFASKTLELIIRSVGKGSEQYRIMSTLFYDQTVQRFEGKIYSPSLLITQRVKNDETFDSIIDSCIESVKFFGLYRSPSEKKNFFGDLDNSMLWTITSAIVIGSFSLGIIYSNYKIDKLLNPKAEPNTSVKLEKSGELPDTTRLNFSNSKQSDLDTTMNFRQH